MPSTRTTMNVLLALLVVVLAVLVGSLWQNGARDALDANGGEEVVDAGGGTSDGSSDTPPGDEGGATDDTTTSSDTGNIVVSEPDPGDDVGLPLAITGLARVFENTLSYRLTDADGVVLVEGFTTADAPDIGQFGQFEVSVSYDEPLTATGVLTVFNYSARDGSEENVVTIPVAFAPVDDRELSVFFSTDATEDDCTTVEAVTRRVPTTPSVARAALTELLQGPTTDESREGYGTSIPSGVELTSIAIADGVATVEFSKALDEYVAGSCRVSVIRSQIEATLLQFPTVESVIIMVEGKRVDEVLQP